MCPKNGLDCIVVVPTKFDDPETSKFPRIFTLPLNSLLAEVIKILTAIISLFPDIFSTDFPATVSSLSPPMVSFNFFEIVNSI